MIYVIVVFLVIWLNKDSVNLEFIGISLVIGFFII